MISESPEGRAFSAYGRGRYEEALPLLSELADEGDVQALLAVAWINEVGAVGSPNIEFAQLCYRRAVDAGSTDALHRLGRLLQNSNDADEAIAMFELGAAKGHLPCICDLGIILIEKAEGPSDVEKGIAWLNIAASRGHLFAKRKLLKIEASKKLPIIKKIKVKVKLIFLTFKYIREYFSDWNSDKIA